MTGETVVNGGEPHSKFLSHLTSYPVVSDGISTYKQNPYGAKSISIAEQGYNRFNSTVYQRLSPYLQTPYSYLAPYIQKADNLGDSGLISLESHFPFVKEDTAVLREKVQGYAGYPFNFANEKKDTLFKIYGEECNKYEKQGYNRVLVHTRALIDTDLRLSLAVLGYVEQWLIQFNRKMNAKSQEVNKQVQSN